MLIIQSPDVQDNQQTTAWRTPTCKMVVGHGVGYLQEFQAKANRSLSAGVGFVPVK